MILCRAAVARAPEVSFLICLLAQIWAKRQAQAEYNERFGREYAVFLLRFFRPVLRAQSCAVARARRAVRGSGTAFVLPGRSVRETPIREPYRRRWRIFWKTGEHTIQ